MLSTWDTNPQNTAAIDKKRPAFLNINNMLIFTRLAFIARVDCDSVSSPFNLHMVSRETSNIWWDVEFVYSQKEFGFIGTL